VDTGLPRPLFSEFKRCYFTVSGKFEIIHVCTYYIDTYLCKFLRQNTIVYGIRKKENGNIFFFEQLTPIIIVFFDISSFSVGHIQSYFPLKICTSKFQDNMYVQKNYLNYFKNFEMAFFCYKKGVRQGPCFVVYFQTKYCIVVLL
jgi:hypothetical protein